MVRRATAGTADAAPRDTFQVALQPPDSVRRAREDSVAVAQRDSLAQSRADSILRASPGYVVDSARSPKQQLARFRSGVPAVAALAGGAPSPDSLVALVATHVNRHDVKALASLAVSRAEFAWLVYPELPIARAPYRQPPDAAWMLLAAESRSGMARLVQHFQGVPLYVRGHACGGSEHHGALEALTNCRVKIHGTDGRVADQQLFGAIVGIGGRYKVLSFGNDF